MTICRVCRSRSDLPLEETHERRWQSGVRADNEVGARAKVVALQEQLGALSESN
jgi:hypothetical protein